MGGRCHLLAYVVRRLALAILVLWGAATIAFFISHMIPSDPARLIAGPQATHSQIESIRRQYGLNLPLLQQYTFYVGGLIHGNLGYSMLTQQPVMQNVYDYFPATVELGLSSFVIFVVLGVPLGVLAAVYRTKWVDQLVRTLGVAATSAPGFWLAIMAQLVFYGILHWLPLEGQFGVGVAPPHPLTGFYLLDDLLEGHWAALWDAVRHLVLPSVTLGLASVGYMIRMTRSSMLEYMREDYVRTARAKGLPETRVLLRHVLRNAITPLISISGLQVGSVLGGVVVIESVFDWPGIGRYLLTAVLNLDFNAIVGVTVVLTLVYVVVNLVTDIAYVLTDPRASLGSNTRI